MSIDAMSWVWKNSAAEGSHLLVMLAIADYHGDNGAWPKVATLAKRARVGERTVQRAIQEAVDRGELEVEFGAGANGRNLYRVTGVSPRQSDTLSPTTPRGDIAVAPPKQEPKGTGKEQELSSSPTASFPTRPTPDQVYLAERIRDTWGPTKGNLTIPALQRLNDRWGVTVVTDAMRSLHGFPPEDAVKSPFAYVEAICKQGEGT